MIESATDWYVTPTSVKAVVLGVSGRVLLGLNPWGRWELPGGVARAGGRHVGGDRAP